MTTKLILPALTKAESLSLKSELKKEGVKASFETESLEGGRHGELATICAVVSISVSAISAIALYLSKKRSEDTMEFEFYKEEADGTKTKLNFRLKLKKEEEAKPQIIEAFTNLLPGEFNE